MMKRLYVFLLAVIVLSSVALVAIACGEEATTTTEEVVATTAATEETTATTEEVTTTEAVPTALTPADAQAMGDALIAEYQAAGSPEDKTGFETDEATFAGPVFSVKDKGTFVIVAIGEEGAALNILVPYDVFEPAGLSLDALTAWMGTTIEVTGTIVVNDWGSLAEMQISDLSQFSLPM